MRKIPRLFVFTLLIWGGLLKKNLDAQLPDTISLTEVINLALKGSIDAEKAAVDRNVADLNFQLFLSELKPQIAIRGKLPNFVRSSDPIIQPDGSIQFKPIRYDNSNLNLDVDQVIPMTGGVIRLQSRFQRFRDGANDITQFNGIPLRLGLDQPLFAYNPYKWQKKIEPLRVLESKQQYRADIESLKALVLGAYFDVLISHKILVSARYNLQNALELRRISLEKFELGRISRNDLLQLRLNEKNAYNFVSQSERLQTTAMATLYDILGLPFTGKISYPMVPKTLQVSIDKDIAVREARANLPEIIAYNRILLERQSELEQARKDNGFRLDLFASFGLFRSAMDISDLLRETQQEQVLSVGVKLPIWDGGARRNKISLAQINLDFEQSNNEIQLLQLESRLIQDILNFQRLATELRGTEEINEIARERFEIAKESFILGSISVTELSISQREQDDAIRSYITTLSNYWNTYYQIRSRTLYDFENLRSIIY